MKTRTRTQKRTSKKASQLDALAELIVKSQEDSGLGRWSAKVIEALSNRGCSLEESFFEFIDSRDFFIVNGKSYGISIKGRVFSAT